jgi:hypothetical protein
MARIRTIHPDFARSRSMRRVSREARLLFVYLLTHVDDAGRGKGDHTTLIDRLYPDEPEAVRFLTFWLVELQTEGCIELYAVDGVQYVRIVQWREYQHIDHPTASRLPPSPNEPPEDSRIREASRENRGEQAKAVAGQAVGERSAAFRESAGKNLRRAGRAASPRWEIVREPAPETEAAPRDAETEFIELALNAAHAGDLRALETGLRHIRAARKESGGNAYLWQAEDVHDLRSIEAHLIEEVGKGTVTPEKGARLMAMLKLHRATLDASNDLHEIQDAERERWLRRQAKMEAEKPAETVVPSVPSPPSPPESKPIEHERAPRRLSDFVRPFTETPAMMVPGLSPLAWPRPR